MRGASDLIGYALMAPDKVVCLGPAETLEFMNGTLTVRFAPYRVNKNDTVIAIGARSPGGWRAADVLDPLYVTVGTMFYGSITVDIELDRPGWVPNAISRKGATCRLRS